MRNENKKKNQYKYILIIIYIAMIILCIMFYYIGKESANKDNDKIYYRSYFDRTFIYNSSSGNYTSTLRTYSDGTCAIWSNISGSQSMNCHYFINKDTIDFEYDAEGGHVYHSYEIISNGDLKDELGGIYYHQSNW